MVTTRRWWRQCVGFCRGRKKKKFFKTLTGLESVYYVERAFVECLKRVANKKIGEMSSFFFFFFFFCKGLACGRLAAGLGRRRRRAGRGRAVFGSSRKNRARKRRESLRKKSKRSGNGAIGGESQLRRIFSARARATTTKLGTRAHYARTHPHRDARRRIASRSRATSGYARSAAARETSAARTRTLAWRQSHVGCTWRVTFWVCDVTDVRATRAQKVDRATAPHASASRNVAWRHKRPRDVDYVTRERRRSVVTHRCSATRELRPPASRRSDSARRRNSTRDGAHVTSSRVPNDVIVTQSRVT